jgi:hypothetical protein
MSPFPANRPPSGKASMPSLPQSLPAVGGDYSSANRRTPAGELSQRAYPWLLVASTAVAGLFCALYITKPVFLPPPAVLLPLVKVEPRIEAPAIETTPLPAEQPSTDPSLIPGSSLPGELADAAKQSELPSPPAVSTLEETNMRMQHVLTAEAPGGHLGRIIMDVPVLYQSRELRWSHEEVAHARRLLTLLVDHQEKTRALRSEGSNLLQAWNDLINRSLPVTELRADSPSLPVNQLIADDESQPADMNNDQSIEIHPAGK